MQRVTVVVPTFNGGEFLRTAVDSVRGQSFTDWTLLVGDNASTDGSTEFLRSLDDPRVLMISRAQTVDWVSNLNDLWPRADTELVAVLHADDWWEPDFLSTAVGALDHFPAAAAAVTATRIHYPDSTRTVGLAAQLSEREAFLCSGPRGLRCLIVRNVLCGPCALYRRAALEQLGGFEVTLPLTCDWHLWLRLLTSCSIAVDPTVQANYRDHGGSLSAEAVSGNLWALDWLRALVLMDALWGGHEPYVGARRDLRHVVCSFILQHSFWHAERARRDAAVQDAGLARAIAGSVSDVSASVLATVLVRTVPSRLLAELHRPMTALATLAMRSRRVRW